MFRNMMRFLFKESFEEFLEIVKACGCEYKVVNNSDYSGFEAVIYWND